MLRIRVLTGCGIAAFVAVTVLGLDPPDAALVFGLVWLVGAHEWARLARFGRPGREIYAGLFLAIVIGVLYFEPPESAGFALLWLAAAIWVVTLGVVIRFPRRVSQAAIAVMGLIVLPAAWWSFYWLDALPAHGPGLALAALVIVWSADIGAFFAGRTLGRRPLAPRVSPKKTWEGVAGGAVLAGATAVAAALVLDLPLLALGLTGTAVALISVIGDLGVSVLKRQAGLKDVGVLLPGHGGIMDRFDGVTAALPFFVLGLQFAHVLD